MYINFFPFELHGGGKVQHKECVLVALFFVVVLVFEGRQNIRILCLSSPFKSESTSCAGLQAGK